MEFEPDAVIDFLGQGARGRGQGVSVAPCLLLLAPCPLFLAIEPGCAFVGELGEVVGFELDAVELVNATQLLYLLLSVFAGQGVLAVLVAGEFAEEVLVGVFLPQALFGAEFFGDGEEGHDGIGLEVVDFHFVEYLAGVAECFGQVGEDGVHLGACLEPFLLGVAHAVGVVQVLARREAEEQVVGFGVVLVEEVGVVGADELYAMLACQLDEDGVDPFLHFVGLAVGHLCGVCHLVALQLQVVVVAPDVVEPLDGLLCSCQVAVLNLLGHFAADAGGADDESFVELCQVLVVGARTHVEAIDPGARDKLDEVVVALQVLCQHDEVPAGLVFLASLADVLVSAAGYIHFAAEDGLEGLQPLLLPVLVDRLAVVVQLLDAEHVAVVGECHAAHAVADGFIDHLLDGCLSVEQ